METLKSMKKCLETCAEQQMSHLDEVNAEELGEVMDMIKDLSEAIYYCTITKAMEEQPQQREKEYYGGPQRRYPYYDMERDMDRPQGRMYYTEYPMAYKDEKEGRSSQSRRMYMESKETHQDKGTSMRELERYTQELTQDIMEMMKDASTDEKQFLSKRVAALAQKIQDGN